MELKRRTKIEKFMKHKEEVEHVQMVKQKLPILLAEDDSDLDADEDFLNMLNQLRRQREDPLLHFEGDTDVDEVYGEDEEEEQVEHEEEEQVEQQQEASKKKKSRKGPTKRSHSRLEQRFEGVWIPSSDEVIDVFDLKEEYDDGDEKHLIFCPMEGRAEHINHSQGSGKVKTERTQRSSFVENFVSLMCTNLGEHFRHFT